MSELIRVPDIGSGEGEVIELMVKVGDRIEADQSLLTLESDKASMEIPAPKAGVIKSLKVKLGDRLKEGDELLELEVEGASAPAAQPAQAAAPAFEVATIRLSPPEAQGALINFPQPGRLSVTNFTLRMLIGQAYQSELGPGFQISGGPSWIEKDRYVLLGQAAGGTTRAEMMLMLKTLLVERFRDELGDWRMTVHCVLGARVNAPWALAIARRLMPLPASRCSFWISSCFQGWR